MFRLTRPWLGASAPLLAMLFLLSIPAAVPAQYTIHTWESFEQGRIPQNLFLGHDANDQSVRVLPLQGAGVPPRLTAGVAAVECGRGGLLFQPSDETPHLSLFSPVSLNRRQLGQNGRALYQADIYLPAPGQPVPNVSLVAHGLASDGSTTYRFYRFGVLEGGERVFFSFTDNEPQPTIYHSQLLAELGLERPGWARFQIIFIGQDQIFCAVNGEPTSFSPIAENTHQVLNAGLMVTSPELGAPAIADNLSIQWTPRQAPLPESPWKTLPADATSPNTTPFETGREVVWLTNPSEAWQRAASQRRPLLVNFTVPNISPTRYLNGLAPNTGEVHELLNRFVLLRIDANQLQGGTLAQRFDVVRTPTLLVLGPDGKEDRRVTVIPNQTTWPELERFLSPTTNAGG